MSSPVILAERSSESGGLGLAPVAVAPRYRRQGIGGRLIRDGLAA
jgi:predicted N-acetyltransferase YhbS